MNITKRYIPCTNGQELEISLSYYRDGKRGYYLSVTPVTRTANSVSFMMFSGESKRIKEVARKSAKAEREAIEEAAHHEQELIAKVLEKNNLELAAVGV